MNKEQYFEKLAQELLKQLSAQAVEIAQLRVQLNELLVDKNEGEI